MATIKDVAKEAGVSLGTVSNVVNKKGRVSPERTKRVQDAIQKLAYTPDATARSLKTNRSMNIGVILPNITDPNFAHIFTGIERVLSEQGYTSALYTSSEIPAKESLILDKICEQRMDGVVVVTCRPQKKKAFLRLEEAGIKMVFLEREVQDSEYNYLGYNNYRSVYDATLRYLQQGLNNLFLFIGPEEYSSEMQCVEGFRDAYEAQQAAWDDWRVLQTNFDKESAFKAAVKLLRNTTVSGSVLITSSSQILEGVSQAVSFLKASFQTAPLLVSLSEETWAASTTNEGILKVSRRAIQLGELAAETLLKNIQQPALFEYIHRNLDNEFLKEEELSPPPNMPGLRGKTAPPLRVLMLNGTAAYATEALLPDFSNQTGIEVSIETLGYDELYDVITQELCAETYDVFQIDLPWFRELVDAKCLVDLGEFIGRAPETVSDYIPGVLDVYAKYHDSYFALPYMFGTQLLFYRKDLFENPDLQFLFQEQYQSELAPPKTWKAFNAIARFFTKSYNPDSPVSYGTTLGGAYSSGAICEFLPRQWAYGGKTLDEAGNLVLDGRESLRALQNYVESYHYASPGAADYWWEEQVQEFSRGETAMMILFVAHATGLTDRSQSKVVGKIGATMIPGGKSMLGGWSLGINGSCQRREAAFQFISWATCRKMAIPYTILGGATPSIHLYKSSELLSIYPWLPKALESFAMSRKRDVSRFTTHGALTEREYEKILGDAVHQAIKHQMSAEDALRVATQQIGKILAKG